MHVFAFTYIYRYYIVHKAVGELFSRGGKSRCELIILSILTAHKQTLLSRQSPDALYNYFLEAGFVMFMLYECLHKTAENVYVDNV